MPAPVAQMEAWSVNDVVAFFESKDARAFGQKLEASNITGADLLHLSVDSLQHTLSFNTFAGQKVCKLKGAVCGGQTRGQTPGQTPGQTLGKPRANPSPLRANPSFAACPGTGKRRPAWQEQVPVSPSNLPIYKSKRLNCHFLVSTGPTAEAGRAHN